MTRLPSPNLGERRAGARPSIVVIHYTGMASCAEARARLCDPAAEVSAHWLISETGEAEPLVAESARAWHAGAGEWGGIRDVNSHSIGIELANSGAAPFAEAQMASLVALLRAVQQRWQIAPARVIGHSDMAPARKRDPGPRFDWRRLALEGVSVWPQARVGTTGSFAENARRFGYPPLSEGLLLTAFRQRFRPWAKGPLDEQDTALIADLADRFGVPSV